MTPTANLLYFSPLSKSFEGGAGGTFVHESSPRFFLILSYYFPVEPKPPRRSPSASSSKVMPYSANTPCAKASPAASVSVFPSFESLVSLIKMCPSFEAW